MMRKVKNSLLMIVNCGYCKKDIACYQKVGRGNLLRMHGERIIESEFDVMTDSNILYCPFCQNELGIKAIVDGKVVFNMQRSTYNTRLEY